MEESKKPVRKLRIDTFKHQYLGLWEEIRTTPLPPRRCYHSSVLIGDKLVIYGGQDIKEGVLGDLWALTISPLIPEEEIWRELPTTGDNPGPLCRHTAIVNGTKMYLFGGTDHANENSSVFMLEFQTLVWTRIGSAPGMPPAIDSHSAILYESSNGLTMLVFGGYINGQHSNDIFMFNLETLQWNRPDIRPGPEPRVDHRAVLYQNAMWVYGGLGDQSNRLSDFWRLNLDSFQWEEIQNVGNSPGTVSGHSLTVCGDVMLLFGGIRDLIKETNSMYTYDFSSNQWIMIQNETLIEDPVTPSEIDEYRKQARQRSTIQQKSPGGDEISPSKKQKPLYSGPANPSLGRIRGKVPHSRDGHSAVLFEGYLYVFAGDRHQMPFNDTYSYSIQEQVIRTPLINN